MNELIQYSKARFEINKLIIDDSITVNEWKELGKALKKVEGNLQFWIGDWARFGEKKGYLNNVSSKVYDELEQITGLQHDTIRTYKHIADNINPLIRINDLSFTHHRQVASLPESKQIELLSKAAQEKLSISQLHEEVKKEKHAEPKIIKPVTLLEQKQKRLRNQQKLTKQLLKEQELKDLAKDINIKYTLQERRFFIHFIKT